MNVSEIMERDFTTIEKDAKIKKAESMMLKTETDFLLVEDQGEAIGIITPYDLLRYYKRDFEEVKVQEAMTPNIIAIEQTREVEEAAEKIVKSKIKQVIVLEESDGEREVIGYLTTKRILQNK